MLCPAASKKIELSGGTYQHREKCFIFKVKVIEKEIIE